MHSNNLITFNYCFGKVSACLPKAQRFRHHGCHTPLRKTSLVKSSLTKLARLSSGKALVRLVMLDYVCCQTSIYILSTSCSATGLTSLCYERSHLMVGFVLICFQHLSAWNTATGRLPLAR